MWYTLTVQKILDKILANVIIKVSEFLRRTIIMKKFVCSVCGYVYEAESLPADFKCPQCKAPASKFNEAGADKLNWACQHVVGIGKELEEDGGILVNNLFIGGIDNISLADIFKFELFGQSENLFRIPDESDVGDTVGYYAVGRCKCTRLGALGEHDALARCFGIRSKFFKKSHNCLWYYNFWVTVIKYGEWQ